MLEVTCFHCGHSVQISPDAERCSVCGMNLRKLIGREQASSYFYQRAAAMAATANVLGALQEVQRGLSYVNSSELNLLGAILCKRLGRIEDMRHYVAAIPVDDPLRGEGEWLLRSNAARQRAPEPPPKGKAPVAIPIVPDSDALPVTLEEVTPSRHHPKPATATRSLGQSLGRAFLWFTLVALLLGGGWFLVGRVSNPPAASPTENAPTQDTAAPAQPEAANTDAANPSPASADAQSAAPNPAAGTPVAAPATDNADMAKPAADTSAPSLSLPTPTIAPDLAQAVPVTPTTGTPTTGAPIASNNPAAAADAATLTTLDWPAFLRHQGRTDLAGLPVTARAQGTTLVLEGSAQLAEDRAALAFLAKQIPGVTEVSAVNVVLRPPATYTVRPGDTLWDISVRIYGSPDRIDALYAANRTQLPSPSALTVGMTLTVP